MGNFYTYLLPSLPALLFGMKPPFTYEVFLERCRALMPDEDFALISSLPRLAGASCSLVKNETLDKWLAFDSMLRNELVKVRASRRRLDVSKYLRQGPCPESVHAAHIAINAYRRPSPLEAERMLDAERWNYLDELNAGHYFDLDALILYSVKIQILQRWDMIETSDRLRLLEDAIGAGMPQEELKS